MEGLRTLLLCLKGREGIYGRYGLADRIITIGGVEEIMDDGIQRALLEEGAVFVPHGTLISGGGLDDFEKNFKPPVFGNRHIFRWEFHRDLKDKLLREAGIRIPSTFGSQDDIDRPVIVKLPGAEGGRGYFIAKDARDLETKLESMTIKGLLKRSEMRNIFIQEYIVGVTLYPHLFHSPLLDRVELMGCDRRYETSIDGIGRISAKDQMHLDLIPTFRVIGNIPIVLRESMLAEVFEAGDGFVRAARKLVPPGAPGPFCLEMVCDEEGRLYTFEFSGRIVAGTNLFIKGSPYSDLLYDEPMSMGRRIAREVKEASKRDLLEKVTT
jgi:5-formaminoimidazole-4-carboxamide-1-(beta)-D-ribofuranosyl 5'-monophosphate synthetase